MNRIDEEDWGGVDHMCIIYYYIVDNVKFLLYNNVSNEAILIILWYGYKFDTQERYI